MFTRNNIIIVVIVVIVAGGSYFYLTRSSVDNSSSLLSVSKTTDIADAKYVLNLLNKMSQIKLNNQIFNNSVFLSLKDTSVSLIPEQPGRINPFAPLGNNTPSTPTR